jgi:Xaa-Pro aminopeptidase
MAQVRDRMSALGVDVLLSSVGADLPWLCGYEAMPLERLTMLVVHREGDATLVVPRLEAPRVVERGDLFALRPWTETEDPIDIVASLMGTAPVAAIGDTTWARFLVELIAAAPATTFRRGVEVTGALRAVKDAHEVEALLRAGSAVDRIAADLQAGRIPLVGRTEAEVSADLGARILDEGHHRVNFAIVAAGANAASPHHEAGDRRIADGEVVLCDYGGTMFDEYGVGYCSDITRCVWTGDVPDEAAAVYEVLRQAQRAACAAIEVGATCGSIDAVARHRIAEAGHGDNFIHRTGHGIGVEAHEDPYIVEGNLEPLEIGHAFSVEPGIYLDGRFGFRLEDCLAVGPDGPIPFTTADHALVSI